jgi:hypothetical protein
MNGRTDGRGHWKQDKQKYFSQNPTSKTHRNYSALTKQPVRNYLDGSADIASTDTTIHSRTLKTSQTLPAEPAVLTERKLAISLLNAPLLHKPDSKY